MKMKITIVLRDLFRNKAKTSLMFLSLLSGAVLMGVVSVFGSFFIPQANLAYQRANPHDAIIRTDEFSPSLISGIDEIPGVSDVTSRKSRMARIVTSESTFNVNLIVLDKTNTVDLLQNSSETEVINSLEQDEVYLERSAAGDVGAIEGDIISLTLDNGQIYPLLLKGIVYDAVCEPYSLEGDVLLYVNEETMQRMTGENGFDEIRIRVDATYRDKQKTTVVTREITSFLENKGVSVLETEVPEPGTFYATQALDAVFVVMSLLGGLSVLLSVIIIVQIIDDLIAKRVRQIAVMKALGGGLRSIRYMYFGMLLAVGFLVFLVALPLSYILGYVVCEYLAGFLNMRLQTENLTLTPLFAVVLSVFVAPILAAWIPIVKGTAVTVKDGLSHIKKPEKFSSGKRIRGTSATTPRIIRTLAFRNLFRNKIRNILSLSAMMMAGAVFMTGLSLQAGFSKAIDSSGFLIPDGILTLSTYENAQKIKEIAAGTEGLTTIEAWGFSRGQFVDETTGNVKKVRLMAPEPNSEMLSDDSASSLITDGRWLADTSANEIVISSHLTDLFPEVRVGDMITIIINEKPVTFNVVGCVGIFGRPADPVLIVGYEYLNQLLAGEGLVVDLRGITSEHTEEFQNRVFSLVEDRLNQNGILVSEMNLGEQMREQFGTSTTIVVWLLVFLSVMIAAVGLIGLSGAMSMSVLERQREFAVLRSIGATSRTIRRILVTEGLCLSFIACLLGVLFSIPFTTILGKILGEMLLGVGTGFALNGSGVLIWLAISFVGALIALILPCARVLGTSIKDSLAYE